MRKVKVITDSTVGLPKEMMEEHRIEVVPSRIILGGKSYLDDGNVSIKELFEFVENTGALPGTTPPTESQFHEAFQKWLAKDYDILFTGIGGKIAGTLRTAEAAALKLVPGRISIVDSLNASAGTGLLVLEAAEMASKGAGIKDITNHVYSIRTKVRAIMLLDTLKYIYIGGKCSKLISILGNTLNLKPVIEVIDGEMTPRENLRGKRYLDRFLELAIGDPERIDPKRIFLTHCLSEETAEVRVRLEGEYGFSNVIVSEAPPTTSVHVGPGSLGIMYLYK